MSDSPTIIGRSEQLNFIDLNVQVPAKIDTGAYHSAIHCVKAVKVKRGDKTVLQAELLGHPCAPTVYSMEFTDYELVAVKNSFGHSAIRYKIKLRVKLGSKSFWASFTLADRTDNIMPVLIGRELVKSRFLVDVSKTSVDRHLLRKIYRENSLTKKGSED
ncbi:MAG TPA: RimK/LysX family protein [Candidatus Saccharimonadales bacterium]|jgi:hypothetical protein|nr:RimK/LysX family protein [Candidatus Saccharimonadales bacterium]